jgi:outer membrane protein assembly factor BamB
MRLRLPLAALCLVLPSAARADALPAVALPGESRPAGARLAEAIKRLQARKPAEAITLLQGLIDSGGNDLVERPGGRVVQARRLAHAALAGLPADALRLYRNRADPGARKWLEAGLAGSDDLLFKVVDEAFCSTPAARALDALGDRAFARGRFDEAAAWWRRLAPLEDGARPSDADALVYPDPAEDLAARIRAKQLLAWLFAGEAGWEKALAGYRQFHGKAEGKLAGQSGKYADILQAVAQQRRKVPPPRDDCWRTFAGAAARGRVADAPENIPEVLARLCRGGPTWRIDLERRELFDRELLPLKVDRVSGARTLAFHPVIAGRHALVADAQYVLGLDLRTGKLSQWYDLATDTGGASPVLRLPAPPDLRYTLTVADGCVFARLGVQAVKDVRPVDPKAGGRADDDTESYLVCLALEPSDTGSRFRWRARGIDLGRKEYAVFEGAPVAAGGRVFVAATRFEGDKVITAVRCYPTRPEDSNPALLWSTDVCATRELLPGGAGKKGALYQRRRHHLLTVAGPLVVYCSHSGVVVALDARTGQRAWAFRYPRRDTRDPEEKGPSLRDLAPPLLAGGKLYVAPADSEYLYCLDPDSGRSLWERRGLDVVHLLGVGQGRLIFTTWRDPRQGRLFAGGLRAVDSATGSDSGGWSLPDDGGGLAPMGRGLLAGDLVLWPTARRRFGVFAVRQRDGRQPDNPTLLHRIPSGNLVYAGGVLLVADQRTLSTFVPSGMLLETEEAAARQAPQSPRARLALARAEADRGLSARALGSLEQVHRLVGDAPGHSGQVLLRQARQERLRVHFADARRCAKAKENARADAALRAAAIGQPAGARLRLRIQAARLWEAVGEPARAVEAWQGILEAADLRGLAVAGEEGLSSTSAGLARAAVLRLVRAQGEANYSGAEKRARALWDAAADDRREAVAWKLAAEFPAATVTARALRWLGERSAREGRHATAAQVWRTLLGLRLSPAEAPDVRAALALAYEAQGCFRAARAAWLDLARHHPAARPQALHTRAALYHVTRRLQRAQYAPVAPPSLSLPLLRRWGVTLSPDEKVLQAGAGEGSGSRQVWSGKGRALICRSLETGEVLWESALSLAPTWAGGALDLALAGGPGGLAALRAADGIVVWQLSLEGALDRFQVAGGRLFCRAGERRLLAVEAGSGRILWQRPAPGAGFGMPAPRGRIGPRYHAGASALLVQASGRLWVLDAATGTVRRAAPTPLAPWPRDPVLLGTGQVALAPGGPRLEVWDLGGAERGWTCAPPGSTTASGEPPLVLGGGEVVFAIFPLNVGYQLSRVAKGAVLGHRLIEVDQLDPSGWAVDGGRLYQTRGADLLAYAVEDLEPLWRHELPAGEARLRLLGQKLLAWPGRVPAWQITLRGLGGTLQWRAGPLVPPDDYLSVNVHQLATGELVQRLNFPAGPGRLRLSRPNDTVPRTFPALRVAARPAGEDAPAVFAAGAGLLIQAGRQAWFLR